MNELHYNWKNVLKSKMKANRDAKSSEAKTKTIRALYLYINRVKPYIFSFKNEKLWSSAKRKQIVFSNSLNYYLTLNDLTIEEIRYYRLLLRTLEKYDSSYGITIGLVLNRLFCRDIAWTIREFI